MTPQEPEGEPRLTRTTADRVAGAVFLILLFVLGWGSIARIWYVNHVASAPSPVARHHVDTEETGDDPPAPLSEMACDQGIAKGCSRLAADYRLGKGVPKDPALELEYLRKACNGGVTDDCARLSILFDESQDGGNGAPDAGKGEALNGRGR